MNRSRRTVAARGVATIVDVAREADVSAATVSRVLNGTSGVSADRAERVRDAAVRLGYQPNGSARALRRQHATVWAAIVPDIENPFFTALVRGIEDVARTHNHRLVLCNSDEDLEREAAYLDIVIAERMAGVVIAVASNRDSSLAPLIERGVPTVAVDRRPAGSRLDSVVVDNRAGAAEATLHLLSAGCTRVGCITGPKRVSTSTERLEGYRDALVQRGVAVDRALVRRADFKEEGGYKATRSLFESGAAPDALFIANNPMAVGALRALRDLGLVVPRDVAIVAFDDSPWTTLTSPELTVVAQPAYEIGRVAAEMLATSGEERPARTIVLSPTLLVRASSNRGGGETPRKRS